MNYIFKKRTVINRILQIQAFICFAFFLLLSLNIFAQQVNIKGHVIIKDDKSPIPNVDIVVKTDDGRLFTVTTDREGIYTFMLDWSKCKKAQFYPQTNRDVKTIIAPLGFIASDKKYEVFYNDTIAGSFDFELYKVVTCDGPIFRMLFKYNTSNMVDSVSFSNYYNDNKIEYYNPLLDVNELFEILEGNPTIVIELSGHCSSNENKDGLSLKRAEVVKQMLVAKGILADRIVTKGYGIKKLRITDEQIAKTKTKEEKEALNQMNRRVVFRILNWDYKNLKTPQEPKYHPKLSLEEDSDSGR